MLARVMRGQIPVEGNADELADRALVLAKKGRPRVLIAVMETLLSLPPLDCMEHDEYIE